VGADRLARLVFEKLRRYSDSGVDVAGCVAERTNGAVDGLPLLGSPGELPSIVTKHGIERVVLAQLDEGEAPSIIRSLRSSDVQVDFVPRPLEAVGLSGSVQMLDGIPIMGLTPIRLSRSSVWLKRMMDVALSGIALLVLSPVLAFIALRIKLDSPGPVFYRHDRVGRDGRPFRLLKFRTMQTKYCRGSDYGGEAAEREFQRLMREPSLRTEFEANYKLQSDPRVTRFGDFLRRASLDELPQLMNVLRGELSLVGPRPIVPDELSRYGKDSKTLLGLRPGVTGLWQVSGRSDTSYEERVRLDIAYASNWSVPLDVSILAHTARTLIMSRGGAY
jgi:exopolysaccharide biosynthesis polyprenyl glycosylphosphotransferase